MNRQELSRILALVENMTEDESATVEQVARQLSGGLSPLDLDPFDPVAEAHRAKRQSYQERKYR